MSREPKKMNESIRGSSKLIVYIAVASIIAIVIVSYIVIANIIGANKEKQRLAEIESREKQIAEQESIASKLENDNQDSESVSTQIGKTVEESNKENQASDEKSASANKSTIDENSTSANKNTTDEKTSSANKATPKDKEGETKTSNSNENKSNETKKEVTFCMPAQGEIVRGFAKESLVYSETLQEWVVHQAIDIKANSRDVVKAAADGTVTAIKSDPRYGLTVIIEHEGGFKTVYSNLLTAEFVVEGEQVKQGQTLGTVGSSATFEIADEPHLHFEMLKDSAYVDPTLYIK